MRLAPILLLVFACRHKPPPPPPFDKIVLAVPTDTDAEVVAALVANFERVYFDLDRATLGTDARQALEANAAILKAHPAVTVQVQGHADARGTIEYNLALGQRRAATVVDYLGAHGIREGRLPVVTYGEERPAEAGVGEVAWAKNRRAEFVVLSGGPVKAGTTTEP